MSNIDWQPILVGGAAIVCGLMVGLVLFVGVCTRIAKAISDRTDRKAEYTIAVTPDEVFIDAIRLYEVQ